MTYYTSKANGIAAMYRVGFTTPYGNASRHNHLVNVMAKDGESAIALVRTKHPDMTLLSLNHLGYVEMIEELSTETEAK